MAKTNAKKTDHTPQNTTDTAKDVNATTSAKVADDQDQGATTATDAAKVGSSKAEATAAGGDDQNATDTTNGATPATESGTSSGETQASSLFEQAAEFCLVGSELEMSEARDLWDDLHCDNLPAELAVAVFDCGVKQDADLARRILENMLISSDPDTLESSLADVLKLQNAKTLLVQFLALRLRRYAFTGNAATKMRDNAAHIVRLHAFILLNLDI